jgi:hypothetical protein
MEPSDLSRPFRAQSLWVITQGVALGWLVATLWGWEEATKESGDGGDGGSDKEEDMARGKQCILETETKKSISSAIPPR